MRLKNSRRMNEIVLEEMVAILLFIPNVGFGAARYVQDTAGPAVTVDMRKDNIRFGG